MGFGYEVADWASKHGYGLYLTIGSIILLPLLLFFMTRLSDKWFSSENEKSDGTRLLRNIDKLNILNKRINSLSNEVDYVFKEIGQELLLKRDIVEELQNKIGSLSEEEKKLKSNIDILEKTSVESAEVFKEAVKRIYTEVDYS